MPAPRPTLRCIREDLTSDWGDVHHYRAISDLRACPPLDQLDHPVVGHAVATFGDADAEASRESISGLSDPMWWKLKTGRWRGAVYVDQDGQAWVCAAGLRRGGEDTDFYRRFMREVERAGPERFLPTEEDRKRLRRELAEASLSQWEQSLHDSACAALLEASTSGPTRLSVPGLRNGEGAIGEMTVEVARIQADDPDESIGEVTVVATTLDWGQSDLLRRAELVTLAAISPDEQAWSAGHTDAQRVYSVMGVLSEIEQLIANASSEERTPGETAAVSRSHYAHRGRLTEQYVDGKAARALCGVYFVPRHDPESMETCNDCESVYRSLAP